MKKETLLTIFCILFVGAFAYFGLPMFAPRIENQTHEMFWETSLTSDNQMKVFGLTLNQSTLQDAIDTFGNRVTLTLYETDDGDQIEGYFRETKVGPFMGRMAFRLNSDENRLHSIKSELVPEIAPMSRSKSYKITSNLGMSFLDDTIFSLAFIPTQIVLTPEDIEARFGKPDLIIEEMQNNQKTGTTHYLYPTQGIDISLDKEKRSIIQYISPEFFQEKILTPITNKN